MADAKTDLLRSLGPSYFSQSVNFGSALDQTGQVFFFHTSSPFSTGFQSGNATAAITYTLPVSGPSISGSVLTSTTAGVLSWSSSPSLSSIIVTTPDGLHTWEIGVDNDGNVTSTQIT